MFKNAILRYKWHALTSVVLTSIVVITTLLQPSYLKDVLTAVLLNDQDEIFRVGKILLVIAGIGLLAGLANTINAAKIAQGVSADIRENTFRKIQSFSYANIEEFNAGNLVVRMTNDVTQIQNLTMMLFTSLQPETYPLKFLLLLLGASLIALGVALQVIANVIMLAGEGIVNAISQRWKLDFGNVKTAFDTTLVITALAFSLLYLDSIEGIREGTLISALITGSIARFFIQHLSRVDTEGHLMLSLVLHPGKPAHPAASPCTKKE